MILTEMAAHPNLQRGARTQRCVAKVSISFLMLACVTEDDVGTADVQGASSDAAAPRVNDAKAEDASAPSPLGTPSVDSGANDAAVSPSDDSGSTPVSPSDDSGRPVALPLIGCQPELPDQPNSECDEGDYACAQGHAYLCIWNEDAQDKCWQYAPDVICPLWSESQCKAALNELSKTQPCNTDADCTVWGGLSADGACNVGQGEPALSVSRLWSSNERDALRTEYELLLSHGCVENWGLDGAPHEAVCDDRQCQAWQESCLDFF